MGCCPWLCLCGLDDDDDDINVQVKKLNIEKTGISEVDIIFEDAAKPFNHTLDVVHEYQSSIRKLKLMSGHRRRQPLMLVFMDLKKTKYPNLKIIIDGPRFELQVGEPQNPTTANKDLGKKLVVAFAGIGELIPNIEDSFKVALESKENVVSQAGKLRDKIREGDVDVAKIPIGLSHVIHNVNQFKRIPVVYSAVVNSLEDLRDEMEEVVKEVCRLDELVDVTQSPLATDTTTPLTSDTAADDVTTSETPAKDGEATETTQLLEK